MGKRPRERVPRPRAPHLPSAPTKPELPPSDGGPVRAVTSWMKKNRLLTAILAGGALAATYVGFSNPSPSTTEKPQTTIIDQTNEGQNEITLGNVRFRLQNPKALTVEKRQELFGNMSKAYQKLVGYFGEEVMTQAQPLDFPLIIEKPDGKIGGKVTWTFDYPFQITPDKKLNIKLLNPRPKSLTLIRISEDYVAHELMHLFAQHPFFLSKAFKEGHAYAVTEILYPKSEPPKELDTLTQIPEINQMLNLGLDYSDIDEFAQGGLWVHDLEYLANMKWKRAWKSFGEEHPAFFKDFYAEVAKLKKQRKERYSKTDLLRIAEQVAPGFLTWYQRIESMQDIKESTQNQRLQAVWVSSSQDLVIANFRSQEMKFEVSATNPKGKIFGTQLRPILTGKVVVTMKINGRIEAREYHYKEEHETFTTLPIPEAGDILKITIGGQEVPLVHSKTTSVLPR